MTPQLSIVIPTHNRSQLLKRTLMALAQQSLPANSYEVIVVADGCQDDTVQMVQSLRMPYKLRFIDQEASGAAAARNRGIRESSSPMILFLDDDMEGKPGLLAAHLEAHSGQLNRVILGYFTPGRQDHSNDMFVTSVNLWWEGRFSEMSRAYHRFNFQDLFAGNVSLSKELLNAAGAFDERFQGMAGEDYELGLRLLKCRARFCFVRKAASIHHDSPTPERYRKRAFAEGRGNVLIARKHPESFSALRLIEAVEGWPAAQAGHWLRLRPWMMYTLPRLLYYPQKITYGIKARQLWKKITGGLNSCAYWRGVLNEFHSFSELQRFLQDLPLHPSNVAIMELDLATDLDRLDEILDANHIDAIGMHYRQRPIGWIGPEPCAEPLRPEHVRHALINHWGYPYLTALLRDRGAESRVPAAPTIRRVLREILKGVPHESNIFADSEGM